MILAIAIICTVFYLASALGVFIGLLNLGKDHGIFATLFWVLLWPLLIPFKLGMVLANAGMK